MRASTRLLIRIGAAVFCAAVLAACGSNRSITITTKGAKRPSQNPHMIGVYSSLPLKGSQRQDSTSIVDGIRLAIHLAGGHVASYVINYRSLDDAAGRAGWSSKLAVRNAAIAARDPSTVAYIGDLDSGATKLSLPILNQAGVVQITPGSGYPGLTDNVPAVTTSSEPGKFYPTRVHTLLRLIPDDMVQAATALELLHSTDCVHVAAASFDGGVDGPALVNAVRLAAKQYGMTYVAVPGPGTKTSRYLTYALKLREASVNCFVLAGRVTPAAVALTERVHAELPTGAIVGSSGFCSRAWTDPARHGVSAAVDPYLYCTSPVLPAGKYPGTGPFTPAFRHLYHRSPGPYALIGYRAAEMVIDAIHNLGNGLDNRKEVLESLIGGASTSSPVAGKYGFNRHGDLSSHAYGVYKVVDGHLRYDKTLTPPRVL